MTRIDHAIFTSTCSMTGQGYRIVAASSGLAAGEKKIIARCSPSHDALCEPSDDAAGTAFYSLDTNRHCIAATWGSGREQTGRGGRRLLTHAFILTDEHFKGFECNPFAVLRALALSGAVQCDFRQSGRLDPIELDGVVDGCSATVESAFDTLDGATMTFLISRAMGAGCVILPDMLGAGATIIEGMLLSVPAALRASCSFSIGLSFAMGRRHRFNVIGEDVTDAKRIIRGQEITLIEGPLPDDSAELEPCPWVEMVFDCRRSGQLDQLVALAGEVLDDATPETLQRIAQRQIDLNHLATAPLGTLLQALLARETSERCDVERALDARRVETSRRLLIARLPHAPEQYVREHWSALLYLAGGDVALHQLCVRLEQRFGDLEPAVPAPAPAGIGAHADPAND